MFSAGQMLRACGGHSQNVLLDGRSWEKEGATVTKKKTHSCLGELEKFWKRRSHVFEVASIRIWFVTVGRIRLPHGTHLEFWRKRRHDTPETIPANYIGLVISVQEVVFPRSSQTTFSPELLLPCAAIKQDISIAVAAMSDSNRVL